MAKAKKRGRRAKPKNGKERVVNTQLKPFAVVGFLGVLAILCFTVAYFVTKEDKPLATINVQGAVYRLTHASEPMGYTVGSEGNIPCQYFYDIAKAKATEEGLYEAREAQYTEGKEQAQNMWDMRDMAPEMGVAQDPDDPSAWYNTPVEMRPEPFELSDYFDLVWDSNNKEIVTITEEGYAQFLTEGETELVCADRLSGDGVVIPIKVTEH